MLSIWALHVVAISMLFVAAAWGAERVLRSRGKTTRFVWAAAFTGSFLSPLLGGLFVAVRDVAASRGVALAFAVLPLPRRTVFGVQTVMGPATPKSVCVNFRRLAWAEGPIGSPRPPEPVPENQEEAGTGSRTTISGRPITRGAHPR